MAYYPVLWICQGGPLNELQRYSSPGDRLYVAYQDVAGIYGYIIYRPTCAVDGAVACEYEGWLPWERTLFSSDGTARDASDDDRSSV